jgi:hypothetical protein
MSERSAQYLTDSHRGKNTQLGLLRQSVNIRLALLSGRTIAMLAGEGSARCGTRCHAGSRQGEIGAWQSYKPLGRAISKDGSQRKNCSWEDQKSAAGV